MAESGRQPQDDAVIWLLCAVSFIESADSAVLAASMISLQEDMKLSMGDLGILYAGGGLAASMFGIVWGVLADRASPKVLLAVSCVGWGCCSLMGAMAPSVAVLFVTRWAQQIMLSSMGPISQSVIADAYEPNMRGTMHGRVDVGGSIGGLLVKPLALAVSDAELWFGLKGWRCMMAVVGCVGLLVACLLSLFMRDPDRAVVRRVAPCTCTLGEELRRFRRLLVIPSFAALLGQGIFGCIAMFARGFEAVYLKHCGFSGADIGTMALFTGIAGLVAAPLNGAIPDSFAKRSPVHGRPCAAQISVVLGALTFMVWNLAAARLGVAGLTVLMCSTVLVGGWVTPGVKKPILSEIVAPAERATTLALLASLEGSLGGILGPPLVGFLAENAFGYRAVEDVLAQGSEERERNRQALCTAILCCTMVPWLMQAAVFFPLLHLTYAKDVLEVKQRAEGSDAVKYEVTEQDLQGGRNTTGGASLQSPSVLGRTQDQEEEKAIFRSADGL